MASRSTAYRHKRGDRINREGWPAMVACKRCTKGGLSCTMSSLSEKCGNCESAGSSSCVPADIPLPNFSRVDAEMERLRKQEEEADLALEAQEAVAEAALAEMRALRAKLRRLRKQKALLKRKEQQVFDADAVAAGELERLEQQEALNLAIASIIPETSVQTHVVDWSELWDVEVSDIPSTAAGSS